jgi:integrase
MAILAECPSCHSKQSKRNKLCSCAEDLDKAKRSKRVRYWIDYRLPDGKQKREPLSKFDDLDPYSIIDAQKALAKRTVQVKERTIFDVLIDIDLTFNELTEWYLSLKKVRKLKTLKRTKILLNKFNSVFGEHIVSDVNSIALENYQETRIEQVAPSTIDTELSIVKTMVNKAFRAGRFEINGCVVKIDGDLIRAFDSLSRKLVSGSNARDRLVSIEEYLKLCKAAPKHLEGMMVIALNTGLRPGEITGLQWSYIDRDAKMIRLPLEAIKEGKKTGKGKNVPINHNVKTVLDSQVRALHHDYVFSYQNKPLMGPQGAKKAYVLACKRAGILYGQKAPGLILPDFRRSAKTYMAQAGVDKSFRDTILGHNLRGMDKHYIKPSDEMLADAMDRYTRWLDAQVETFRGNVDHSVDQTHFSIN